MRAAAFVVLTLLGIASQPAFGATVRVDFAGSVDVLSGFYLIPGSAYGELSPGEAEGLLGGSIRVGTPFSGYISYDDSTLPSDQNYEPDDRPPGTPVPGAWALYFFYSAAANGGEIGEFGADAQSGGAMEISDNELHLDGAGPSSLYLAGGLGASGSGGVMALYEVIVFAGGGSPGSPLHGTSLDAIPWNLESFPNTRARWTFTDGTNTIYASGVVTSLVPEPAAVGLVALAVCALVASRRGFSGA